MFRMNEATIRWDRWLAIGALVATIIAMAVVVLSSVSYQRRIGTSGLGDWSTKGIVVVGVLLGLPLAVEIGAVVSRGTVGIVLRWTSAVMLGLLVLLFAFGGGVFFLPAVALMVASAVLSTATSANTRGSDMSDA